MSRNSPPVCTQCGLGLSGAFDAKLLCTGCRRKPPAFDMARAPWCYRGPVQQAIQQFKYNHCWRLTDWLVQGMARSALTDLPMEQIDFVVPVPMHWLKKRLKGFDHTVFLARSVARILNKPFAPQLLQSIRWTKSQTRLGFTHRFRNVRGKFRARSVPHSIPLLVDDVLTSGATAHACAKALKEAGARQVFVITAARTPLSLQ